MAAFFAVVSIHCESSAGTLCTTPATASGKMEELKQNEMHLLIQLVLVQSIVLCNMANRKQSTRFVFS